MPVEIFHNNQTYASVFDVPSVTKHQKLGGLLYRKHPEQSKIPQIVGRRYADGNVFLAYQGVNLIPGADSYFLAKQVAQIATTLGSSDHFTAVDIGTGCGIYAAYLADALKDNPESTVVATDISGAALEVAATNMALNTIHRPPQLRKRDLLTDIQLEFGKPDLIVSNPPYVPNGRLPQNGFEPNVVNDGGDDGMEIYRQLLTQSAEALAIHGVLILQVVEMGVNQVIACIKNTLASADIGYIRNPTTNRICGLILGEQATIEPFVTGMIA